MKRLMSSQGNPEDSIVCYSLSTVCRVHCQSLGNSLLTRETDCSLTFGIWCLVHSCQTESDCSPLNASCMQLLSILAPLLMMSCTCPIWSMFTTPVQYDLNFYHAVTNPEVYLEIKEGRKWLGSDPSTNETWSHPLTLTWLSDPLQLPWLQVLWMSAAHQASTFKKGWIQWVLWCTPT